MQDGDDQPRELCCEHCGYNVVRIPDRRCPECGRMFDPHALAIEFDRARRVLQRTFRRALALPTISGIAAAACFAMSMALGNAAAAGIGVLIMFVVACLCVADATVAAPEVARARKALGHHGGVSDSHLIMTWAATLMVAQVALLFASAAVLITIVRIVIA